MVNEAGEGKPQRFRFETEEFSSAAEYVDLLADAIAREIGCDEVSVQLRHEEELFVGAFPPRVVRSGSVDGTLFELESSGVTFRGQSWPLPLIVHDLQRARIPSELALELAVRKVRSCGVFPLIVRGRVVGVVECVFTRAFHRWKQEELSGFEALSRTVEGVLFPSIEPGGKRREYTTDELKSQYRRLARYGNIIILITDSNFKIGEVVGNTEQLLGVSASEMLNNQEIWDQLLDPRDRGLLRRRIMRLRIERDELREEVRFIHQKSGDVRWMMLRALPQFSTSGTFQGWEGFGIDTTDRRRAQEALMAQNRRLEAVFEVSRALQGQTDPAAMTLRGLRALIRATSSDCGYGCFYQRDKEELEVVAAQGLSEQYLSGLSPVLQGPSLLRNAINDRRGLLIDDLQEDVRAVVPLAKLENLRSTVVMPLTIDGLVFGAIVLFKREPKGYSEADFDLVSVAATQITLAVRQAENYESERRHGESLGALYRISHELSKYRTPREIAEHAFPVLQQEFALKRIWFGIMNDQGTHLVGKAGCGQGVRRQLQEIQIELNLRHDFLDEAFRTQRAVFVEAGQPMECSGLNRIVQRLKLESLLVIPLVSLGQVIGMLVVEPLQPGLFKRQSQIQLIASMANEMATVLMSRRFESKMAEALKMRMAGLLASGVAHNFNNLLQAVLGQVALIELQVPKGSPALEATRTINEAAKRGATLVSQLLNFAAQGRASKQTLAINRMLQDSKDLYQSLLGTRIEMEIEIDPECPDLVVDMSQIQQVVTNLLANAKDAIGSRQAGKVSVSTHKVRLRSGEIDPELSPGVYVRIDVQDNGVGMDAESQARCFEPFFTTKNVDRSTGVGLAGSGLGLSAAYSMVKQHDGLITVHSVPGEGASFSVYLPILSVRGPIVSHQSVMKAPRAGARAAVLLLAIESGVQPFVSSIFESLGYRSRSVFDYIQTLDVLKNEPETWGYVLVDVDLMSDSAVTVCTQLLGAFPELCIIATSASPKEWSERLPISIRLEMVEKPFGVWSIDSALGRLAIRMKDGLPPSNGRLVVEKVVVDAAEAQPSSVSESLTSSAAAPLPTTKSLKNLPSPPKNGAGSHVRGGRESDTDEGSKSKRGGDMDEEEFKR